MSKNKKNSKPLKNSSPEEVEFSPRVEKIYKRILRIMSWIVGIAFVVVLILPEFNSLLLDRITKFIFLIGLSTLLVFIIIEFIKNPIKTVISSLVNE